MLSESKINELCCSVVLCDNYSQYKVLHARMTKCESFITTGKRPQEDEYPLYFTFAKSVDGRLAVISCKYSTEISNGKNIMSVTYFKKNYMSED